MAKPTIKAAVNVAKGKPSYLAFRGDANWFDPRKTEVMSVKDDAVDWDFKAKPKFRGNTLLVVILKSKGPKAKEIPELGTITVTLTNVTEQPAPAEVVYADDPDV